jgi:hypothetical protein
MIELHKTSNLLYYKVNIITEKKQPTEWEEFFASSSSDRKLISRIYKELKKLSVKRSNNSISNWTNELNRQISKEV